MLVLFDGDERFSGEKERARPKPVAKLTDEEKTLKKLSDSIFELTRCKALSFPTDGGNDEAGQARQEIHQRLAFLQYQEKHVGYLPWAIPESALWDEASAKGYWTQQLRTDWKGALEKLNKGKNAKQRLRRFYELLYPDGEVPYEAVRRQFVDRLRHTQSTDFAQLVKLVNDFLQGV